MSRTQSFYFPLCAGTPMVWVRGGLPRHLGRRHSRWARRVHRSPAREGVLQMTNPMFASIRKYSGAPLISDELIKHEDSIKTALTPIKVFHAYYMVKTS